MKGATKKKKAKERKKRRKFWFFSFAQTYHHAQLKLFNNSQYSDSSATLISANVRAVEANLHPIKHGSRTEITSNDAHLVVSSLLWLLPTFFFFSSRSSHIWYNTVFNFVAEQNKKRKMLAKTHLTVFSFYLVSSRPVQPIESSCSDTRR